MGRNNLDGRLATLESATTVQDKQSIEDDPRVIAYRKKSMHSLWSKVQEAETGIKEWEHLDLPGRVQYWREKVAEAEYVIESNGIASDDDIAALTMSETTLGIMRELRFEIASEGIEEYREGLEKAQQEMKAAAK